jgi:bis(5'-nucleosidyl)-tetraphosphatase
MNDGVEKDEAFGVIPYRKTEKGFEVLMVEQKKNTWSFPKGHREGHETPKETALRECKEETGITVLLEERMISEEYTYTYEGNSIEKKCQYWFAHTPFGEGIGDGKEITSTRWMGFDEAVSLVTYPTRKDLILRVRSALEKQ